MYQTDIYIFSIIRNKYLKEIDVLKYKIII